MLQIREKVDPFTTVLRLTGQLELESVIGIKALILGTKEQGCQHVILDFSGISGISWFGLAQLFLWYQEMEPHYFHVSIVNPSSHIQEVLERNPFSGIVPVFASQEEAIKYHENSSA
jgi:anti-anti-sigma factor